MCWSEADIRQMSIPHEQLGTLQMVVFYCKLPCLQNNMQQEILNLEKNLKLGGSVWLPLKQPQKPGLELTPRLAPRRMSARHSENAQTLLAVDLARVGEPKWVSMHPYFVSQRTSIMLDCFFFFPDVIVGS